MLWLINNIAIGIVVKIGSLHNGIDNISNEFFIFSNYTNLVTVLRLIFNSIISTCCLPPSFNTSVLILIPKKGELNSPSDYRPISISTSIVTLFEYLLLMKTPWLSKFNANQQKTSCKSALL